MFRVSSWSWAQVLSVASPCLGVVTVVSSERSVVARAEVGDGRGIFPYGPNVPVAAAGTSRVAPGAFDYTTGDLEAYAPWLSPGGFLVRAEAHSSASIESVVSATGFGHAADVAGHGLGTSIDMPGRTEGRVLYKVRFAVDRPTPFTISGQYRTTSPDYGTYRLRVSLDGFLDVNVVSALVRLWGTETFGASGVLQPGTLYTLESEAFLETEDIRNAVVGFGDVGVSFAMVVPEPVGAICVAACFPFVRRTRR
jgi:hypothetical protein